MHLYTVQQLFSSPSEVFRILWLGLTVQFFMPRWVCNEVLVLDEIFGSFYLNLVCNDRFGSFW